MRSWAWAATIGFLSLAPNVQAGVLPYGKAQIQNGYQLQIGELRYRLNSVDSFELGQTCWDRDTAEVVDCGVEAKRALEAIVGSEDVLCDHVGQTPPFTGVVDTTCSTAGGDIATALVQSGWALVRVDLIKSAAEKSRLCNLEADAKRRGVGAWRYRFALPYVYRGEKEKPLGEVSCGNAPDVTP